MQPSMLSMVIVLLFCCSTSARAAGQALIKSDYRAFRQWAVQHNKPYQHDPKELFYRYTVWSVNVGRINKGATATSNTATHRLGLTAHTDLTREEFRSIYLGAPMTTADRAPQQQQQHQRHQPSTAQQTVHEPTGSFLRTSLDWLAQYILPGSQQPNPATEENSNKPQHWRYENVTAPAAADWRQHKPTVLGAIKDQHVNGTPCGSCWAFSAVSIMEIASAMASGKVVLGSEQHLIDCDRKYDHGCAGGGWLNAIQYTIKHRGLATEQEYPYTGKDGHCNKQLANERHELKVDSWEDVPFSNETELAKAVSQTPVIVAICCGPAIDDWHHYADGIFDAPCCEKEEEITLDHGIVVVGYGTENGQDYWILKNSWGAQWGEQGFMRISRNHGKHGKCALASYPAMVFRKPLPDGPTPPQHSNTHQPALAAA